MSALLNLQAASQFLLALSSDTLHTFQIFDDTKSERKGITRAIHGTFESKSELLANANDKGAGVFVMVNKGDGNGRKKDNVQSVRAVFLDLDGAPLVPVQNAAIPPPIIVETSPNKYHAYWPVSGMPLEKFKPIQQALAEKFNGDKAVCDLSRVMRLPGFYHRKATPFLSRLVKCDKVSPVDWLRFVEAMGLAIEAPKTKRELPTTIAEGTRNNELYGLASGLRQQGLPHTEALSRLAKVNIERCKPPLLETELAAIVENAWTRPITNFTAIPNMVLSSPVYLSLSSDAKAVMTLAYRNYNGSNNGKITLTDNELKSWGLAKRSGRYARNEAQASGLLIQTKKATSKNPKPAFYQLQQVHK